MNTYEVQRLLEGELEPLQVSILSGIVESKEGVVADRLGITRGRLRHLLFKSIRALEERVERNPKFRPLIDQFKAIVAELPKKEPL